MTADRSRERNRAGGGRLEKVSGPLLVRRFSVRQPEMFRVVETVASQKLTSIDRAALCELAQTAMDLEYERLDGDFLQAGCGAGGAAIVLAHAKRRARALEVHDPFAGGPEAEALARRDLAAHGADERLNVQLFSGPYEQTLWADGPIALAHADCGEYGPMRVLLERLAPRLVSGGCLIVDDYGTREECRRAVDDHFRGKKGFRLVRKSRLHVTRS
ncbi:MAG TPA: TylF/MycF/NovP-related O-methyltransferase [Candidatus Eisenbacteria bacterium]|nr:TylF/MycF/NovP-related O-methyltransferase [Candidatus Eisenbacteria bacterium]